MPDLINNSKNPDSCVSGKLVYEKKKKAATAFPTETISKSDMKVGDAMVIALDTTESK